MRFARSFATILAGGWRASPGRTAAAFALLLVSYASAPLAPLALKHVTDAVVAGDARTAGIAAAFLPLVALVNYTGGHIAQAVWVELCDLHVIRVGEQVGALVQGGRGLEHHERPDYADRLELMRNEGNPLYRSVQLALSTTALAIQFAITVVLLMLVEPLLLLLLVAALAPFLAHRWGWRQVDAAQLATADRSRLSTHLVELAVRPDTAKEIRIFGLQDELRRRLREVRHDLRSRLFRAELTAVVVEAAGQLAFALAFVGGLVLVVRGAIDGRHSVGDVVLVVTLAMQVNGLVLRAVGLLQWVQRSAAAMERIAWLRDLTRRLYPAARSRASVPGRLHDGIRLEDVSFRYPGTDRDALRSIGLHLPAGTTVAFVGENGAGKSTLVKLLCAFYRPTGGWIAVDGIDLGDFSVEEWRERIAAGFQDFVRLELLARESVGVGDLPVIADGAAVAAAIERAAAGDVVAELPAGLETYLGKRYTDGAELSGGQWQKVALARAMMRPAPLLLVLDEPTASLDAYAEHMLFERYAASARSVAQATGGIAVFVSHRFSTVRMADLIVVLDDGAIVEQGTHAELHASGGLYAELFALQAAAFAAPAPRY